MSRGYALFREERTKMVVVPDGDIEGDNYGGRGLII